MCFGNGAWSAVFFCIIPSLHHLINWANSTAGRGINNNKYDLNQFKDEHELCNGALLLLLLFFLIDTVPCLVGGGGEKAT